MICYNRQFSLNQPSTQAINITGSNNSTAFLFKPTLTQNGSIYAGDYTVKQNGTTLSADAQGRYSILRSSATSKGELIKIYASGSENELIIKWDDAGITVTDDLGGSSDLTAGTGILMVNKVIEVDTDVIPTKSEISTDFTPLTSFNNLTSNITSLTADNITYDQLTGYCPTRLEMTEYAKVNADNEFNNISSYTYTMVDEDSGVTTFFDGVIPMEAECEDGTVLTFSVMASTN